MLGPDPADINSDGIINIVDLVTVSSHFGEQTAATASAPSAQRPDVRAEVSMRVVPRDEGHTAVEFVVESSVPIAGYEFHVGFDPSRTGLEEVQPADFFGTSTYRVPARADAGSAHIGAVGLRETDSAATSGADDPTAGVLATIVFRTPTGWEAAALRSLLRDVVVKGVILSDATGRQIGHRVLPSASTATALRTEMLPNYPNPFNPETWIPFQLSEASSVQVTIYNAAGQRVCVLDLGYVPAGAYTSRSKSSHWDGTNETGERVASGIYFYELRAGDFSALRRMVVHK